MIGEWKEPEGGGGRKVIHRSQASQGRSEDLRIPGALTVPARIALGNVLSAAGKFLGAPIIFSFYWGA